MDAVLPEYPPSAGVSMTVVIEDIVPNISIGCSFGLRSAERPLNIMHFIFILIKPFSDPGKGGGVIL